LKKKLILASSSPRRKQLLENMGLEFEIIPSDYEEILETLDFSYEKIEKLAYKKGQSVLKKIAISYSPFTISLILSADTVVVLDGKILGKPKDEQDAINMLKQLSGKRHSVITSVCIINTNTSEHKILSETSFVEFEILDEKTITDYVFKYKPLDKAGSYGIQELPACFVKRVDGSFENIIGLCPEVVIKLLKEFYL
jgi:septum formation protein